MSLLNFWTPDSMAAAQANLQQAADGVNTSVQACTTLDPTTSQGWTTFYTTLKAFTSQVPVWLLATGSNEVLTTGTRADQLNSYQAELTAWQSKLSAKCKNVNVGLVTPSSPDLANLTKWAVVGVTAVAVAVVVSNVTKDIALLRPRRA